MHKIYRLRGLGCVRVGESIWFSHHFFNALIELNKSSGQIKSIEKFPVHDIRETWLYTTVCCSKDKLIFIPGTSDKIAVYDIKIKKFIFVGLDQDLVGNDVLYFWNAYRHGQYIYMLPRKAKCIVRYNIRENTVKYLHTSLDAVVLASPEMDACFAEQFEVLDEKIYMPFVELSAVAVFDLKKEKMSIKYLDIENGCSTIIYFDEYFYMTSSTQPIIYQWNTQTDKIKKYDVFPEKFRRIGCDSFELLFISAVNIGKKIYFFPFHSNMIISLDVEKETIETEKIYKETEKTPIVYYAKKIEDKRCVLITNREGVSYWDYGTGGIERSSYFEQDDLYNKRIISDYLLRNTYFDGCVEEENMLKGYLDVLENSYKMEQYKQKYEYGKLILDHFFDYDGGM